MHPNLFWGQKKYFSGEGAQPPPPPFPYPINAYGALPPPYWNPKYVAVVVDY